MQTIPSHDDLASLTRAITEVVGVETLGFARHRDEGDVAILYATPYGIGQYVLQTAAVPAPLLPSKEGFDDTAVAEISRRADGAIESHLRAGQVQRVFSAPVLHTSGPTRFWMGTTSAEPLTPEQARRVEAIAAGCGAMLERPARTDRGPGGLERLELAAGLLPTLLHVLDVRDVFDRLSTVSQAALPHDMLMLVLFNEDLTSMTVYARTGMGDDLGRVFPQPYAPAVTDAWDFDIIDDRTVYPLERDRPPTQLGMRSSLRMPFRFDGRTIGGLAFHAREPRKYTNHDVPIARRLADHVAVALSHHILAQRLAEQARNAARLESRVQALTDELNTRTGYHRVVGESKGWRQVLTHATQVAATDTTVLLLGESGTGKEVVARFLHKASGRNKGPFVALNCAALPEQLLEAELFGYERGAYTGATQSKPGQLEQAAGGTLFLDEIGEMSAPAQAKFLRVLQEREFQRLGGTRVLRSDARIVAATNRDLLRAISNGLFREDLYYRLNVFAIHLPPLRDRRDDILPLSDAFLTEIARGLGRPPGGISRDARQMLIDYHWPGNVRELRNILEGAAILCDGGLITPEHLALNPVPAAPPPAPPLATAAITAQSAGPAPSMPAAPAVDLQSMERAMIEQALLAARFNKSKAAKALGLTRHQLYIRMRRYGFD
jgi:two-component system response regulator AtoC